MCLQKAKFVEKEYNQMEKTCKACTNLTMSNTGEVMCKNYDCSVFYPKLTAKDKIEMINSKLQYVVNILND